ncbi:HAD-IA family hydrolase, partial [Mesorhizobium sp.]|uniref:HAD-IA family hydrolase n=1 Tax=Mesorhizobium sp. TaxID=1871066 RepID=UPI000FE2B3F9
AEALLIAEHPDHAENIRNFRRLWHEMVPHAYDDSVQLMDKLIESGHDVTMLTNFASDTLAEARQRFDFLNRPRGVTISGEIGMIKPDRRIYDHHVAAFGLEPAATLFIDDSQKNVDGAKAAGWQSVLFTDAKTLAADLDRLGIRVVLPAF